MSRPKTNTTLKRIITRHLDSTLNLVETAMWLALLSKMVREAYDLIGLIK